MTSLLGYLARMRSSWVKGKQKVKIRRSYPCNRPWRPIGLCDVEDLTFFYTIGSEMAVKLSVCRYIKHFERRTGSERFS
jgi:hypothetical protein